jgi:hypothetical protein
VSENEAPADHSAGASFYSSQRSPGLNKRTGFLCPEYSRYPWWRTSPAGWAQLTSILGTVGSAWLVGLQGVTSMALIAFTLVTGLLLASLTSRPTDLF